MATSVTHTATTLEARVAALEAQLAELAPRVPEDRVAIVVFSGDLDRLIAAHIIATGAAAMGQQVSMFFTFWGLNALRQTKRLAGKRFTERLLTLMSPGGPQHLPLSRMNFFGMGAGMLRRMMADKHVASLEQLSALARELGVRVVACEMSRDVMAIQDDELAPGWETGGVGTYLGEALKARATLFI